MSVAGSGNFSGETTPPSCTGAVARAAYRPRDVGEALRARLRSLRGDEHAQMLLSPTRRERRERPEATRAEGFAQIVRYLERLDAVEKRPRTIAFRGRDLRQAGRSHASLLDEARHALLVRPRPSAARTSRSEQQHRAVLVEGPIHAVDPPIRERIRDRLLVREARSPRRGLVGHEPHAGRLVVVVAQPAAPRHDGVRVNARERRGPGARLGYRSARNGARKSRAAAVSTRVLTLVE